MLHEIENKPPLSNEAYPPVRLSHPYLLASTVPSLVTLTSSTQSSA